MARLIPPVYIDNHSSGEAKIFEAFERDNFSKDWVVLHSFDLPKHLTQGEGEVDFLVLIKGCGVLCMEVKASAKISRKGGIWRYGSGNYRDARGPFKQVKDNTFSLMRRIKTASPQMRTIPFFPVVAFTNCNFRNLKIGGAKEWDDDDFIDLNDFQNGNFIPRLKQIFENKAAKHSLQLGEFVGEKFDEMLALLRPDFEAMLTPRERMQDFEVQSRKYTSEQFKILDSVILNDRIAVDGLAGTGKTVMAIEYARRMSKNASVLFVTPISSLGKYLKNECALEYPKHFVGSSAKFLEKFDEIKNAHPEGFDFLILDEAQDFVSSEIFQKFDSLLKGGILNGKWIMFGDYRAKRPDGKELENFERFKNTYRPAICKLTHNCRNPESVARLVEKVSMLDSKYQNFLKLDGDKTSQLKIVDYENADEQSAKIANRLESLLNEKTPENAIAILSMRPDMLGIQKLLNSAFWKSKLSRNEEDQKITYAYVDDFKGLEQDFVLLCDIEDLSTTENKRLFYIGATRTRVSLTIFYKMHSTLTTSAFALGGGVAP